MSRIVREPSKFTMMANTESNLENVATKIDKPLPIRRTETNKPLPIRRTETNKPLPIRRTETNKPLPIRRTETNKPLPIRRTVTNNPQPSNRVIRNNPTRPKITRPQNITSFTYLPDDVMTEFVSNMTCFELRDLKIKNPTFSKFITKNTVKNAINLGYPRPENKAKIFRIEIDPNQSELSFYKLLFDAYKYFHRTGDAVSFFTSMDIIVEQFPHLKGKFDNVMLFFGLINENIDHLKDITSQSIVILLNKMILAVPKNIIKGDIIIANFNQQGPNNYNYKFETIMIYDGNCKFMLVDQLLPPEFIILEDNVPAFYWFNNEIELYVNIDLNKKRKQILDNAKILTYYSRGDQNLFHAESNINGVKLHFIDTLIPNDETAEEILAIDLSFDIGVCKYVDNHLQIIGYRNIND